jgi:hypothetical protein
MIRLYIKPAVIDEKVDYVILWTTGWLYSNGYSFKAQEYDYEGDWTVEIYTKGLEVVSDVFEFVLGGFGDGLRYFVNDIGAEIEAVVACSDGDECFDVWFEDLEQLEQQEHLEVEERLQKMESMIYGQDDDPEYQEYLEAVEWERMVGIRNDGGMKDAVLYQEEYE